MTVREEKTALRERFRALRRDTGLTRPAASEAICTRIAALTVYRYASVLLLYAAMPGEPDLKLLAALARKDGKSVAYPRSGADGRMTFHIVGSESELKPGLFGIPAPGDDAPLFTENGKPSLCVVPGLAFDRSGMRLGHGGGYYDRFLSSYHGTAIGAVFPDFLISRLPGGRHDIPVRLVVTGEEVVIPLEKQ